MKFALFLGCMIPRRLPFLEKATRSVLELLDIETVDLPFGCCPDPSAIHSFSKKAWMSLAARNLVLAEEQGLNILTLCNGCFETLKVANTELKNNSELKKEINGVLKEAGKAYKGTIEIKHVYEIVAEFCKAGNTDNIKKLVTRPLGLKIAVHYGCHLLKPAAILQVDNPDDPSTFDCLIEAIGCESVDYTEKLLCCGFGTKAIDERTSYGISRNKLKAIKESGVDGIAVTCPSCFQQFDAGQVIIKKEFGEEFNIPVYYFMELFALSMGVTEEEIGLNLHRIKIKGATS
ncbi:MAG: CoB--CoM heterodisulfide reductase iron-sulfur subunit B family protein [Candidatus Odinarchaeota archaeon]